MPASRRRTMQREAVNPNVGQALPNPSARARRPAQSGSGVGPNRPEWATERWKLQVEAEARSRMKKIIRDFGSKR